MSAGVAVSESVDSVTTINTVIGDNTADTAPFSPEFDLKTNLLQDAVGTMSIGGEVKLSRRFSLDIEAAWNPWTFKDYTMYKQWSVFSELRWWPRQKGEWLDEAGHGNSALRGHFIGFHILGGEFNYSRVRFPFNAFPDLKGHRFEGWMLGGGISYGYRYNVSRRFALETTLGIGVLHTAYDKYNCGKCAERIATGTHTYVGPTHAALSLIVRIGKNPRVDRYERVRTIERTVVTRIIDRTVTDTVVETVHQPVIQPADTKNMVIHKAVYTLSLTYPLSSSEIVRSLGDNAAQIDSLSSFIDRYSGNPSLRIASIDIVGYASLEGSAAGNLRLSEARAASAARLVETMYPSLASLVNAHGAGEDWTTPQFNGKNSLLSIPDLDERERRLRAIDGGHLFRHLLDTQLPATRRIECIINYTNITQE